MYQYLTLFNGWLILHCMSIPHYVSLCSTVDGHLSCVHFLVTVNSAAINIPLQAFIWKPVFSSFGYIKMSQICRWRHPHGRSDHPLDEGESKKAGFKLNIQKTKIMASGLITSWQIDRESMETVRLYLLGIQNHCRWLMQPWN